MELPNTPEEITYWAIENSGKDSEESIEQSLFKYSIEKRNDFYKWASDMFHRYPDKFNFSQWQRGNGGYGSLIEIRFCNVLLISTLKPVDIELYNFLCLARSHGVDI